MRRSFVAELADRMSYVIFQNRLYFPESGLESDDYVMIDFCKFGLARGPRVPELIEMNKARFEEDYEKIRTDFFKKLGEHAPKKRSKFEPHVRVCLEHLFPNLVHERGFMDAVDIEDAYYNDVVARAKIQINDIAAAKRNMRDKLCTCSAKRNVLVYRGNVFNFATSSERYSAHFGRDVFGLAPAGSIADFDKEYFDFLKTDFLLQTLDEHAQNVDAVSKSQKLDIIVRDLAEKQKFQYKDVGFLVRGDTFYVCKQFPKFAALVSRNSCRAFPTYTIGIPLHVSRNSFSASTNATVLSPKSLNHPYAAYHGRFHNCGQKERPDLTTVAGIGIYFRILTEFVCENLVSSISGYGTAISLQEARRQGYEIKNTS